jgi:hypothetical protein
MLDEKTETRTEQKGQVMAHAALTAELVNGQVAISSTNKGSTHVPKGSPPQRFSFTLTDNTGLNVNFLPSPDFLCADESGNCPPAQGINTDQIDPHNLVSNGKSAGFTDLNSRACTLSYALYFSCDNGSTPSYDPIIINGGQ